MPTIDIAENDARIQYTATASQTTFTYDFVIFNESDIVVVKSGVTLTLGGGNDYTVAGVGVEGGGTVTLNTGATLGDTVTLYRSSGISRASQYQSDGIINATTLERDFDVTTTILQELSRDLSRSITLSIEDTLDQISLPNFSGSANKAVTVNSTADGFSYATLAASTQLANYETETFDGDNSTKNFTVTNFTPLDADQIEVAVDGASKYPIIDYTLSGAVVSFVVAPPSGTDNVFFRNLANGATTSTIANNSITTDMMQTNIITNDKVASSAIGVEERDDVLNTDFISGVLESPQDKSYTLVLKSPFAGEITEVTTISSSGTCTATFKINTTTLGGTVNSVSTSEESQAHASDNVFSIGDDIILTVSSNSSCEDMSFTIKFTRTG